MRRLYSACLVVTFVFGASFASLAQVKPVPGFADYGKFESIAPAGGGGGGRGGRGGGGGGGLSTDGKWLGYTVTKSNRDTELRLLELGTSKVTAEPNGAQLTYTSDMKWAAWSVGYSQAQQDRMRTQNQPVQNKLALMNLATGTKTSIDNVQSFSFSSDGKFLLVRRYPPAAPGGGGAAAAAAAPAGRAGGVGRGGGGAALDDAPATGGTIGIRNLATGAEMTFGNVGEETWQDVGAMLAMTISAADQAGNGVQLYNAATGELRVLDSAAAGYLGLAWRSESSDLLVMRTKADDKKDGLTYQILAWTGAGTSAEKKLTYDPTTDTKFPAGNRLVSFRRPSWSDDGKSVFLGFSKWDDKPAPAGRGGRGASGADAAAAEPPVEPADVVVWNWQDADVMSKQKLSANADRRRNLLAVWHLDSGALTPVGKDFQETVTPIRRTNTALVSEWGKYAMERSIGRGAADLYLADLTTGARTPLKMNVSGNASVSTNGKYVLFVDADQYWTINLTTKAVTNITAKAATSFVNRDSDQTTKQKPMFGTGGWTKDDAAVVIYDKYDIWQVAADGSSAKQLTDGKAEMVVHRLSPIDPSTDGIDLAKPQYVTLFGTTSKKSGYGMLKPGASVDRLMFADKSITGLAKAKDADVYVHTVQDYNDSPDMFVSGADLKTAKQVTTTNAFLGDYAWGKTETVDYVTDKWHGMQKLQGTLYYPAGYEPGKQYPMIVYMYELLSDNAHRFVVPSDRDYYNTSVFTTQGYFVLQPDITFKPREPGLSVVSCVTAAIKAVTAKGPVDPKRVGVIGHSWGGFDSAFLATHTNGLLATAIAGAAITDLVSNYGNGHWSSGIAETDHIETGQQRMEVPLYEDLQAYIRNSAVFNVANMTVPLLLEVGNQDGTVFYHQGVELYNIARRAKKPVVMIEYNGEDHGLSQYKDQKDYQQRILQWFGHYLKGDKAPDWITKGQSYLERQDEVKKLTTTPAGAGRGGRGGAQ